MARARTAERSVTVYFGPPETRKRRRRRRWHRWALGAAEPDGTVTITHDSSLVAGCAAWNSLTKQMEVQACAAANGDASGQHGDLKRPAAPAPSLGVKRMRSDSVGGVPLGVGAGIPVQATAPVSS